MGGGGAITEGQWAATPFALFLVQAIFIIALARVLAFLLKYMKQPAVVAEMLSGIIIGPTVLGRVPGFTDSLFPTKSLPIINVISSFGLVFFLFIVGLELDTDKLRADFKVSMFISFWGIVVPFIGALLLAIGIYDNPAYSNTSYILLALFLTCALGISALPVLARILAERRMLTTRLGGLSMTVAAVDDVLAWVLLAILLTLVRSTSSLGILWTVLLTVGELLFMAFVVRPVIKWLVKRDAGHTNLSADTFLYICLVLIVCSYVAEIIGLSALIGAFQVGLLIPRASNLSHHISEKLEYFVVSILMPIYFASSGLKTQFGLINDGESVGMAVLIIVVATVTKVVGILIPTTWLKIPCRMGSVIAVLMSCKGLIALIVVNFGVDNGIITPRFFAILVLMVLITTMQTVPIVLCVDPPSRAKQSAAEVAAWEESQARQAAEAKAKAEAKRIAKAIKDGKAGPAAGTAAAAAAAGTASTAGGSEDPTAPGASDANTGASGGAAGREGSGAELIDKSSATGSSSGVDASAIGRATSVSVRQRASTIAMASGGGVTEEVAAAAVVEAAAVGLAVPDDEGVAAAHEAAAVAAVEEDARLGGGAGGGAGGGVAGLFRQFSRQIRGRAATVVAALGGGAGDAASAPAATGRSHAGSAAAAGAAGIGAAGGAVSAEDEAALLGAGAATPEAGIVPALAFGAGDSSITTLAAASARFDSGGSSSSSSFSSSLAMSSSGRISASGAATSIAGTSGLARLPDFNVMMAIREPGLAKTLVRVVNLLPPALEGPAIAPAAFLPGPAVVAAAAAAAAAAADAEGDAEGEEGGPGHASSGEGDDEEGGPAAGEEPAAVPSASASASASAAAAASSSLDAAAAAALSRPTAELVAPPVTSSGGALMVSKASAILAGAGQLTSLSLHAAPPAAVAAAWAVAGVPPALDAPGAAAAILATSPVFAGPAASAAQLLGGADTRLTLTWVLDSIDMPSSYMNFTDKLEDIRDANVHSAMDACRLRRGLQVSCFPSKPEAALRDACEDATSRRSALLLCTHRLLRDNAAEHPSTAEELVPLLQAALHADRPCYTAILFTTGPLEAEVSSLAVAVDAAHPAASEAALFFARKVDSAAADVLLLCTGYAALPHLSGGAGVSHPPGIASASSGAIGIGIGVESAASMRRRSRAPRASASDAGGAELVSMFLLTDGAAAAAAEDGAGSSGAAPAPCSLSRPRSTRVARGTDAGAGLAASLALPPVPESAEGEKDRAMPTVGTFAALLKGASEADIRAYEAAVAAALAARHTGGDDDDKGSDAAAPSSASASAPGSPAMRGAAGGSSSSTGSGSASVSRADSMRTPARPAAGSGSSAAEVGSPDDASGGSAGLVVRRPSGSICKRPSAGHAGVGALGFGSPVASASASAGYAGLAALRSRMAAARHRPTASAAAAAGGIAFARTARSSSVASQGAASTSTALALPAFPRKLGMGMSLGLPPVPHPGAFAVSGSHSYHASAFGAAPTFAAAFAAAAAGLVYGDLSVPAGFALSELPVSGFLSRLAHLHLHHAIAGAAGSAAAGSAAAAVAAAGANTAQAQMAALASALASAGLPPGTAAALAALTPSHAMADAAEACTWPLGRPNTYEIVPLPTESGLATAIAAHASATAAAAAATVAPAAPAAPMVPPVASAIAAVTQPQALARLARATHGPSAAAAAAAAASSAVQLVVIGADPRDYTSDGTLASAAGAGDAAIAVTPPGGAAGAGGTPASGRGRAMTLTGGAGAGAASARASEGAIRALVDHLAACMTACAASRTPVLVVLPPSSFAAAE